MIVTVMGGIGNGKKKRMLQEIDKLKELYKIDNGIDLDVVIVGSVYYTKENIEKYLKKIYTEIK